MKTKYIYIVALVILCSFASCKIVPLGPEEDPGVNYMYSPASHFQISSLSQTSIKLQWTNANLSTSGGIAFYSNAPPQQNIVQRSVNGTSFQTIAALAGNSTSVVDYALDTLRSYNYRIRSVFSDTTLVVSDTFSVSYGASFPLESSFNNPSSSLAMDDISPNETSIAWVDNFDTLHITNFMTGIETQRFAISTIQIEFSSNHYISGLSGYYDTLIHDSKPMLLVYDLTKGSLIHTFKKSNYIFAFKMDPEEKFMVTGGESPTVVIWSLQDSSFRGFDVSDDAVSTIDISPDGSLIATNGSSAANVFLTRSSNGTLFAQLAGSVGVFYQVAFSLDGRYVAASGPGEDVCWNISTRTKVVEILRTAPYSGYTVLAINNNYLITGDALGIIRFWKLTDGSLFCVLAAHSQGIGRLKLSMDGKRLFSLALDKMNVWSLQPTNNWHPTNKQ